MKNRHTRDRKQVRALGARELGRVTGGDGTPMPAARRDSTPLPMDGMPMPALRREPGPFDDGTPIPA